MLHRREFEFLQKILCNCHNVHGSAISRNFLRRMNGARIICFKQKCYTFQKNVHTYVKCPFEIEFFLLPFFEKKKRLSIETFIIIATGYVHCISFEKSAKKSNDFRTTKTLLRSSSFDVQRGFDFKKIQMTCTQRRKKVIVVFGKICKIFWKWNAKKKKKWQNLRSSLFYVVRFFAWKNWIQ